MDRDCPVMTRYDALHKGGVIIADLRRGEVREQVWRMPDGELLHGTDWYPAIRAPLYPGPWGWYEQEKDA